MKSHLSLLATAACLSVLGGSSLAQTARALIAEGDDLSGPHAGQTVTQVHGTGANGVGGFTINITSGGPNGALSQIFGAPAQGEGSILRTERTVGGLTQIELGGLAAMDDLGQLHYTASVEGGPLSLSSSVWSENQVLVIEGDPHPSIGGWYWSVFGSPQLTSSGELYYIGTLAPSPGYFFEDVGWFKDDGTTWILKGHDIVPGVPHPLSQWNPLSWNADLSADGQHYITWVQTSGPMAEDYAMVMDGAGMVLGGAPVREGQPIPASIGGLAGEVWASFGAAGITDDGSYFFAAGTSGVDEGRDAVLVVDGVIEHREGDVLDGEVLAGEIAAAEMTEDGRIAFLWGIEDAQGVETQAIFAGGELLLKAGDAVDLDGDGEIETDSILMEVRDYASLTFASEGALYFVGRVDWLGTPAFPSDDTTAAFKLQAPPGERFCFSTNNSTGEPALIRAEGSASLFYNDLELLAEPVPNQPGLFFYAAGQGVTPFGNGFLCLSGQIFRLLPVQDASANRLHYAVDYESPPSAAGQITVGSTWSFQAWFRDPAAGGAAFNLSDGLEIAFHP